MIGTFSLISEDEFCEKCDKKRVHMNTKDGEIIIGRKGNLFCEYRDLCDQIIERYKDKEEKDKKEKENK